LGEERFRQEWSTFKSDDQKRWTNYTLTQEELQRENSRRVERLADQTSNLEDGIQEIQDIVQHLSDQSDKLLQSLLANLRDWVAQNERFFGSVK
jgi:predicted  nucleic acid-binding Zn-ribbon protein